MIKVKFKTIIYCNRCKKKLGSISGHPKNHMLWLKSVFCAPCRDLYQELELNKDGFE